MFSLCAMPDSRWALSLELPGLSLAEHKQLLPFAESVGYTDSWSEETAGHDGFSPLLMAAEWTTQMRLGTAVVNVFTRGPAVLSQHASALSDISGDRFCLGIGSSSDVIVERWNGMRFTKPRTRVRETISFLRSALEGERAGAGRFKLTSPPKTRVPIFVAALRERMLETAGELGDGAIVNFLPRSAVKDVLSYVQRGEELAGKAPKSTEVVCRFFCIQGDKESALALAQRMFCAYATVPVYEQFFRWLGYGDQIDPLVNAWRSGDRAGAVQLAPRELVEDIFILGEASAQRAQLEAFVQDGITCPVILPVPIETAEGKQVTPSTYKALIESLGPS
jgi:probable F420-dependent oxidoreductase